MHLSLLLAQKIAVMFLMMFCGFMLVRLKIVKSTDSRVLARVCMYVVIPCMIIDAFQIECTPERMYDFLFMILAIILLVFGHGLNMVLNVLSVIVHGIRLNTLEFSSHLNMSWTGHKFKPFKE